MQRFRGTLALVSALGLTAGAASVPACRETMAPPGNLGPEGGRIELAGGAVVLDVPAGALGNTVEVTAQPASDVPTSSLLVPGTAYEFGPDGLQFALPVTLSLRFDPDDIPAGIRTSELRLNRSATVAWQPIAESSVDDAAQRVSAAIQGFSVYAILGVPVVGLTVSPPDVQLMPTATQQLTATPLDEDDNPLPDRAVSWSSANEEVATVDDTGLVTAVDVGTTMVTATSGTIEASVTITVADANAGPEGALLELADGSVILEIPAGALAEPVLISAVLASNPPLAPTLVAGTTYDLRPDGLTFSVPATLTMGYEAAALPSGVRASELRLYRRVANAWSEITGSAPDGQALQVSASIDGFSTFGVLGEPVTSIELNQTEIELAPDETIQLDATMRDGDGVALPDRIIIWTSNDTDIATVSTSGLVTAVGAGSATIAAETEGVQAAASVVVVAPDAEPGIAIVASGLTQPVHVTAPPGDMQRVFIVEQPGTIRILRNGSVLATPFLDIQGAVLDGGERGLLSLAFHPQHASNGYFFVYYTNNQGNTRVVRYSVSADPDVADATSGDTVLTVVQPFSNHNGGLLAFGPNGYLHVGLGDGGSGGDPQGHGQDSTTLLGALLRLDVNGALPYEIPVGNPLVGRPGARPEIWAYGLRNPWRYSFDRGTGDLFIADVGQNQWEEINVQPANSQGGENYGWNVMEGLHCYNAQNCDTTGLTLPIHEYSHSQGCSVTGGYVYRGAVFPNLRGTYFYADYCEGIVRSFRYENGNAVDHRTWSVEFGDLGSITSFGEDAAGEMYVTTSDGVVRKIVPQP